MLLIIADGSRLVVPACFLHISVSSREGQRVVINVFHLVNKTVLSEPSHQPRHYHEWSLSKEGRHCPSPLRLWKLIRNYYHFTLPCHLQLISTIGLVIIKFCWKIRFQLSSQKWLTLPSGRYQAVFLWKIHLSYIQRQNSILISHL